MKRKLVSVGVAALLVAAVTAPVYAQGESDNATSGTNSTNPAQRILHETTETLTKVVDNTTKSTTDNPKDVAKTTMSLREQIEDKRTELKNQIQQKLDARKEKLQGRRLAQCENRQATINSLISKSAEIGQDRLTLIKDFETRALDFASRKNLSSAEIDAAKQAADSAEVNASAAIDVMDSTTFDCSMIDGANPTASIKNTRQAKHDALQSYRAAVVQLIQTIKSTFSAQQSTDTSSADNGVQS